MHRVERFLIIVSTAATLDGLVSSREALAGCSPSPTPGNDNIVWTSQFRRRSFHLYG
jgi:hypothetical protein